MRIRLYLTAAELAALLALIPDDAAPVGVPLPTHDSSDHGFMQFEDETDALAAA